MLIKFTKLHEKIFKADEQTIRLWLTTDNLKPFKPFRKVTPGFFPTKLFVQRKEKNGSNRITKNIFNNCIRIFLQHFFGITWSIYIGSTLVKKDDPISSVFKFANDKLGFPENNEFLTSQIHSLLLMAIAI